jgi:hypothetical protein
MMFGQSLEKPRRENQCSRFGDFYYSTGKYRDLLTVKISPPKILRKTPTLSF